MYVHSIPLGVKCIDILISTYPLRDMSQIYHWLDVETGDTHTHTEREEIRQVCTYYVVALVIRLACPGTKAAIWQKARGSAAL